MNGVGNNGKERNNSVAIDRQTWRYQEQGKISRRVQRGPANERRSQQGFPLSHALGPQAMISSTSTIRRSGAIPVLRYRGEATEASRAENCTINDRESPCLQGPMMSSQAKIARKHASARGPDRRAVVKTVGRGLADRNGSR